MEAVRAIVFDAVGTLITPDPPAGVAYHLVGKRHGSRRSEAEVIRRFAEAFRRTLRETVPEPHRTDEMTERAFWRSVVRNVFDDLPPVATEACFIDLFEHFSRPDAWRVYPDAGPALRKLNGCELTLAVASNFDSRLHAVFGGYAELAPIVRRFVSSELGWRKPDGRFFGGVCAGLGLRPGEVLYVGDEPESDVAAATAAGLQAFLLRRAGPGGDGVLTDLTQLVGRIAPTSGGDWA
jgi:putative hydrolase of the HAD superfamily